MAPGYPGCVRLLLVRHGQSQANLAWATDGTVWPHADEALTELGHVQAQALAHAFATGRLPRPGVLATSLMARAVDTVAPTAAALGMPVAGLVEAYEVGSSGPGLGRSALLERCPGLELPDEATEAGWYLHPAEEREEAWDRATRVVSGLVRRYGGTDDLVVLVTHGMFIQLLMGIIGGWEVDFGALNVFFNHNNTGHTLLTFPSVYGERCLVGWVNRTDHLRPDQLSD